MGRGWAQLIARPWVPIGSKIVSARPTTRIRLQIPLLPAKVERQKMYTVQQNLNKILKQKQSAIMSQFQSHVYVQRTCTENKGITTMAIGPLDDHTYCARSAFTHCGFSESCAIVHCITSQPTNVPKWCSIGIFINLKPVG